MYWPTGQVDFKIFSCLAMFSKEKTKHPEVSLIFSVGGKLFSQADKPFWTKLHHIKTFLGLVKPGRQNNAHSRSSIVTTLNHNASLKIPKSRPSWKTYHAMKQNLRCFSSNLTIFSITKRNSSELIGTSLKSHEIYLLVNNFCIYCLNFEQNPMHNVNV